MLFKESNAENGLCDGEIRELLEQSLDGEDCKKVLIIPPDYTRCFSKAGFITNCFYHMLESRGCHTDILIAQGTHKPVSCGQWEKMYGDIPYSSMIPHRWREDTEKIGHVPDAFVKEVTEGLWDRGFDVEINRRLLDRTYDRIISVGQVVPHEVTGMSNHSKNLFVGAGGSEMINYLHMIGAVYGIERIMGREDTPVRRILDYSMEHFMGGVPVTFVLTVTTEAQGQTFTHGVYIGEERSVLTKASAGSRKWNIEYPDRDIKKCVVYLDPEEFTTTWVGNKAIYRTRMAMADAGELLILAPGVERFGEDKKIDEIISRYGYCGRREVLKLYGEHEDLRENMSAAAHLIHGSSDGRFKITYAVRKMTERQIRNAHFQYAGYQEMQERYHPGKLKPGWNTMPDGEEIFYVSNPALGLWAGRERLKDRESGNKTGGEYA